MGVINLDPELKAKLNGLNEKMVVIDEQGRPMGCFLPVEDFKKYVLANLQVPFSDEEIAKFRAGKGGSSLEEFWVKMAMVHGNQHR